MNQTFRQFVQMASGGWRPLAAAVALIFTLGIVTSVVSAQDDPAAAGFNSPLPGPGGQHGGGNSAGDLLDGIVDIDELMAEALGITVDELEAAREEGTLIDELIDALGLDAETVHQEVQDAVEAVVEQAVTDGLLSEEEAEAILNQAPGQEGRPGPGGPGVREDGEMLAPGDETSTDGQTFEQPGRGPGAGGAGGRGGRR